MKRLIVATLFGLGSAVAVSAQVILLDNFNGGGSTGIIPSTSWVGNVVLNGSTITVGGTALNDNGWGTATATIDATGMQSIAIVAQRDGGNAAPSLVIAFEDISLNAQIFSVPTFSFTTGAMTTVLIPISSWGTVDPTQIIGWTIGGGTAGVVAFGMTFDNLSLSTTAVPEPGASAALAGIVALGFAFWRRRARRTS